MVRGCALIDSRLDTAKICSDGCVHVDHAQLPTVFGGEKTFSHGLDPELNSRALLAVVECTHYSHDISGAPGSLNRFSACKGKSRPGVTPDGFSCDCRLWPAPVPPRLRKTP